MVGAEPKAAYRGLLLCTGELLLLLFAKIKIKRASRPHTLALQNASTATKIRSYLIKQVRKTIE